MFYTNTDLPEYFTINYKILIHYQRNKQNEFASHICLEKVNFKNVKITVFRINYILK